MVLTLRKQVLPFIDIKIGNLKGRKRLIDMVNGKLILNKTQLNFNNFLDMHNLLYKQRTKFYLNQQDLYLVLKMLGLADILMPKVPFQASLLKIKNRVNM